MKKIYLSLLSAVFAGQLAHAQAPTLTKAVNEPINMDSNTMYGLDTSNALPNSVMGSSVTWNFSGVSTNTVQTTTTYSNAAAVSTSTAYTGCTLVGMDGTTNTYYKSTSTTFEVVGVHNSQFDLNFSNSAIMAQYPIAFNYTNTDPIAGAVTASTLTGSFTGTVVTKADGTGTLNFNSGTSTLSNVLRVSSVQTVNLSLASGVITGQSVQTIYNYYHSSSKFPVATVQYTYLNIPAFSVNQTSGSVSISPAIVLGVNEKSLNDVIFTAYPNPASDNVSLHFVLTKSENYQVEITNTLGQTLKTVALNNLQPGVYNEQIDLTGLNKGFYFVKVKGTHAEGVQKILVQ